MTLISVYNSEGCIGRCDAKCYDATSTECDCICGGRNHGAGKTKAENNTRQYCEKWLEDFKQKNSLLEANAKVNSTIFQLKMF